MQRLQFDKLLQPLMQDSKHASQENKVSFQYSCIEHFGKQLREASHTSQYKQLVV
jgi:hypothetical protein